MMEICIQYVKIVYIKRGLDHTAKKSLKYVRENNQNKYICIQVKSAAKLKIKDRLKKTVLHEKIEYFVRSILGGVFLMENIMKNIL